MLSSARPDFSPPPGAKARSLGQLLAEVDSVEKQLTPSAPSRHNRLRTIKIFSYAAALIGIAFVGWLLLGGGIGQASASFGDMLRKLATITTVKYTVVTQMSGQEIARTDVTIASSPYRSRIVSSDGKTSITDRSIGKMLVFTPQTMQATLFSQPISKTAAGPLQDLLKINESDAHYAGMVTLDGIHASLYEIRDSEKLTQVWVDSQRNLPLRLQVTYQNEGRQTVMTLSGFEWNIPLPDSLFAMNVPAGYALVELDKEGTEASVVETLRSIATMNGGTFAANLETKTVLDLVLEYYKDPNGPPSVINAEPAHFSQTNYVDPRAKEALRNSKRASAFIKSVNSNGSWVYAGQGVKLGDHIPVCWWQPAGSSQYRVIYGDLQVMDVTSIDLPDRNK